MRKFCNLIIQGLVSVFAYIKNQYIRKSDAKRCVYQILEVYRNSAGVHTIEAKIIDSQGGVFRMPAVKLTMQRRDILSGFSTDDIINIVALATADQKARIVYKKPTSYKYFGFLSMLFGATIIVANIASSKLMLIFGFTMTGGAFVYPIAYILGDIITEVYGYKRTRQLIWGAIASNLVVIFFITMAIIETPSPYWHNQREYAMTLGAVPRIVLASLTAYALGEFTNSFIIAKLKLAYNGQKLWLRIIGAAIFGITVDALAFVMVAFLGVLPIEQIMLLAIKVYLFNLSSELLLIPVTTWLINLIKSSESLDIFDINTSFTPFSLDVSYTDLNNKLSSYNENGLDNENNVAKPYPINRLAK